MSLQDTHRARIRQAIERKGLATKQVAIRAGLHERTVRRFLDGETFNLDTLAALEQALRLDPVTGEAPGDDSDAPRRTKVHHEAGGPVVGWRQAAIALGVGRNTLTRKRKERGDRKAEPWWKSVAAVREWFERLLGREEEG